MSVRSVGHLQTVTGLVAIARASALVAQPIAGDAVYQGDAIETGIDGSVTIAFRDGTRLRLYADTRMELDEFPCGAERLPTSLWCASSGAGSIFLMATPPVSG